MNEGILVPIAFFALVFASLYVHLTTRNKERLALIANGANPELFKSKSNAGFGYATFKIGLFLIGIALGIVAGYFLSQGGMDDVASYFSMIFLFGGIGLVLSFLLQGKLEKK
jgi:FtsH-binding integral membrane protein